jgi:hypothetical protein
MERKKIIDLIKLEVLSCLTEKDRENLKSAKMDNDDFPWKELGEYQHIVALLPTVLDLNNPSSELKDKTAMKLYNIRDQIKAKIDAKKVHETVVVPVEEEIVLEEKTEFGNILQLDEKVEVEEQVLVGVEEGIKFTKAENIPIKAESFNFVSNVKEKGVTENISKEIRETVESLISKTLPDKEIIEKITRDYINSHLPGQLELMNQKFKKNRLMNLIFFVIALILIGVVFFIK